MLLPVTVKPDARHDRTSGATARALAGPPCGDALILNHILGLMLFVLIVFAALPATAGATNVCDRAAQRVASESGVPLSVLWSITRTETGRNRGGQLQPWPWTVNMEGEGHWFETEDAARAYVFKHFKRGARSFDVGCFQINYKWHGTAFRSIDQMFDPLENARYAAAFLQRLYEETGDWSKAAGAYHSRTPEYSNRYRARFDRIRKKHRSHPAPALQTADAAPLQSRPKRPRVNTYPLLKHAGATRSFGSLVPLGQSQGQSLFKTTGNGEGS